jgi:pyruvate/2-oxoglutarate dehydrogenase complex dihydrolipoamide acyltransferase (E2) component
MKRIFLPSFVAAVLASAALQAMAVGRVADVNVIDRSTGQTLPVHFHRGEYWVAGQPGAKYSIQIRNSRGARVLAVTSVDGLNVLSGETADFSQSGYVFESGQRYGIEGWRKSDSEVAAFVFTASGDSYAERIGKPRDMGVIGVALFRERPPVALYSPPVVAAPAGAPRKEGSASSTAELSDKYRESVPTPAPPAAAPAPAPAPIASSAPQADANSRKAAPSVERSAALPPVPAPAPTPKLGTAHGERETSIVSRTQFIRNSAQPDEIIRIRYDSHANLVALGVIPSPRYQPAPNPFPGSVSYVPDPPAWR